MATPVIDRITRGASGAAEFAIGWEADMKLSYVTVLTVAERDALPEWKRMAYMTINVVADPTPANNKEYTLGSNVTIAGQVWTAKTYGIPSDVLTESDILDGDGFIQSQLIRNIFLNDSYVVASEAAMLALTTITGNFVIRTDDGQVYVKLNNDNPADIADFATTSNPAAVISVNGLTGAVVLTVDNLLAYGANQTQFDAKVTASATVVDQGNSINDLYSDLIALETYVDANIVGIPATDLLKSPTVTENGYTIKWNHSIGQFDLLPITSGSPYIFSNGIGEAPAGTVKLGGALTANTTISGLFHLNLTNSGLILPNLTLDGDFISAANGGIYYNTTDHKFRARVNGAWTDLGSGWALTGTTTLTGAASIITSTTNTLGFTLDDASTNTTLNILTLTRSTLGTALSGLGLGIRTGLENGSGTIIYNNLYYKLVTPTNAAEDTRWEFTNYSLGSSIVSLEVGKTSVGGANGLLVRDSNPLLYLVQASNAANRFYIEINGTTGRQYNPPGGFTIYDNAATEIVRFPDTGAASGRTEWNATSLSTQHIIFNGSTTAGPSIVSQIPLGYYRTHYNTNRSSSVYFSANAQDRVAAIFHMTHAGAVGININNVATNETPTQNLNAPFLVIGHVVTAAYPMTATGTNSMLRVVRDIGSNSGGFDQTGAMIELDQTTVTGDYIKAWDGTNTQFNVASNGNIGIGVANTTASGTRVSIRNLSGGSSNVFRLATSADTTIATLTNTRFDLNTLNNFFGQPNSTGGVGLVLSVSQGAHTALSASNGSVATVMAVSGNLVQFNTGAVDIVYALQVAGSTISFVGSSTITDACTIAITGTPVASTNATITNLHSLYIPPLTVNSGGTVTNSYGLTVNAHNGATNNWAAQFLGGVGIRVRTGSAPSTNPTDSFQIYSADIAAGNAAAHFRTELGDIIKLYAIGGWGTPTNTFDRTTFDTTTVTLPQLASRVGALISDLKTLHGLLKA
jgi:hypothetical protein